MSPTRPTAPQLSGEVARPLHRVVESPAVVGQVEVLDAELASVVEPIQPAEQLGEVDDTGRIVDVQLRVPGLALAELHVVGELEQLVGIAAPVGHVAGVDEDAHVADLGPERPDRLRGVHGRAGPRFQQRARRPPPPPHRPFPRAVELARSARAWCTTRRSAWETRSGTRSAARAMPDRYRPCSQCGRSRRRPRRAPGRRHRGARRR